MTVLDTRLQGVAEGYINQDLYAGIGWQVEKAGEVIALGAAGTSDEARETPLTLRNQPNLSLEFLLLVSPLQFHQNPSKPIAPGQLRTEPSSVSHQTW